MGDRQDREHPSEARDASAQTPVPAFVPVWVPENVSSRNREVSPSSLVEGLRRRARAADGAGHQSGFLADARLLRDAADTLEGLVEQVRFAGECLQAARLTATLREEDRTRLEAIAALFVSACRVDEFGAVFSTHDGDLAEALRLWRLRADGGFDGAV